MSDIKRSALLDTDFISKLYITKANDSDRLIFRILGIPGFQFLCHEQTRFELGKYNQWAAKWLNENSGVTVYTDRQLTERLIKSFGNAAYGIYVEKLKKSCDIFSSTFFETYYKSLEQYIENAWVSYDLDVFISLIERCDIVIGEDNNLGEIKLYTTAQILNQLGESHLYGHINKTAGYKAMRRSNLKEMQMVRYADDFRILCRTKDEAEKVMVATTQWLSDRLKLEVSPEKTRVVNTRQKYSEFLGFKMKVRKKGSKHTVRSHMCDKALKRQRQNLSAQAKNIAKPRPGKSEVEELRLYNSMVLGIQNYYRFATHISRDCSQLNRSVMTIFTNRLRTDKGSRLRKKGRKLTETEKQLYGKSLTIRYISGSNEPIYPISYIKTKAPIGKRRCINPYTPEGRVGIHDNLCVNVSLMWLIMKQPLHNRSAEYADNRISLFTAQWGKCGITGIPFQKVEDVHCHHKIPVKDGGTDKYANLILVHSSIHRLIHATEKAIIKKHLYALDLSQKQIEMLNKYRLLVGNRAI